LGLARNGASLILHGRNPAKLESAIAKARAAGAGNTEGVIADLASLAQVRELADKVSARAGPLHVLICNAGVFTLSRRETKDGFELMMGVNHLAHFLLTNLLIGKLKAAAPARIVIVASAAHHRGPVVLDDLDNERVSGLSAYGRTKFANILFAKELARRLAVTGVTANALHPGFVATNMTRISRPPLSWIAAAMSPIIRTPKHGAETSVYLASSPEAAPVSGKYFVDCREAAPDPRTDDPALARALWEVSAALVGLSSTP
jgi:NAD(P)-dependent dehydrogenase (short-subunit alcohol dehydrogenase family)